MPTHSNHRQVYNVFLLARPPKQVRQIYSSKLCDDKYHLLHWGVLITKLPQSDIEMYLDNDNPFTHKIDVALGTLYELSRSPDDEITVDFTPSITPAELCEDWFPRSAKFLGTTRSSHEQICIIGTNFFDFKWGL